MDKIPEEVKLFIVNLNKHLVEHKLVGIDKPVSDIINAGMLEMGLLVPRSGFTRTIYSNLSEALSKCDAKIFGVKYDGETKECFYKIGYDNVSIELLIA